jgi:hypothetical protein
MITCTPNTLSYENMLSYTRAVLLMYSAEGCFVLPLIIWSVVGRLWLFIILITCSHFFFIINCSKHALDYTLVVFALNVTCLQWRVYSPIQGSKQQGYKTDHRMVEGKVFPVQAVEALRVAGG